MTGSGASNREKVNYKGALDLSISSGDSDPAKYWIAKEQLGDTADIALEVFKKVPVFWARRRGARAGSPMSEAKWLLIAKNGIVNALTAHALAVAQPPDCGCVRGLPIQKALASPRVR